MFTCRPRGRRSTAANEQGPATRQTKPRNHPPASREASGETRSGCLSVSGWLAGLRARRRTGTRGRTHPFPWSTGRRFPEFWTPVLLRPTGGRDGFRSCLPLRGSPGMRLAIDDAVTGFPFQPTSRDGGEHREWTQDIVVLAGSQTLVECEAPRRELHHSLPTLAGITTSSPWIQARQL